MNKKSLITQLRNAARGLWELGVIRAEWLVTPCGARTGHTPSQILVIGYMGLGDLLMFAPTLRNLKDLFPGARITFLTGPYSGAAQLATALPDIDEILTVDYLALTSTERKIFLSKLRNRGFDTLIAPYTAPIRFFLPGLKDIPVRVGMVRHLKYPSPIRHPIGFFKTKFNVLFYQENLFKKMFFNHPVFLSQSSEHEIDKYLALIKTLAPNSVLNRIPRLYWPTQFDSSIEERLQSLNLTAQDRLIAIHPAASKNLLWKLWPLEKYVPLIKKLLEIQGLRILLVGTQEEEKLSRDVFDPIKHPHLISLMGQTSVLELAALLKKCTLFIGGDSGPGHLAMAVGCPSLRIFGPSDVVGVSAWGDGHNQDVALRLVCQPCYVEGLLKPGALNHQTCGHHACLNDLTPEFVWERVKSNLERIRPN